MPFSGTLRKELFFVAVKAFLIRQSDLFIFKDRYGDWDFPGGRLTPDDFDTPLEVVLRRKISQELGDGLSYRIGEPVALMRHERIESAPGDPTARIFAIGYEARWEGGEIHLSAQHVESKWVATSTLKPELYFSGGWLGGARDYLRTCAARSSSELRDLSER